MSETEPSQTQQPVIPSDQKSQEYGGEGLENEIFEGGVAHGLSGEEKSGMPEGENQQPALGGNTPSGK